MNVKKRVAKFGLRHNRTLSILLGGGGSLVLVAAGILAFRSPPGAAILLVIGIISELGFIELRKVEMNEIYSRIKSEWDEIDELSSELKEEQREIRELNNGVRNMSGGNNPNTSRESLTSLRRDLEQLQDEVGDISDLTSETESKIRDVKNGLDLWIDN